MESKKTTSKEPVRAEEPKTVKIYIPTYQGDSSPVVGSINGKNFRFPRNVWVEVPVAIANVVSRSQDILRDSEEKVKGMANQKLSY